MKKREWFLPLLLVGLVVVLAGCGGANATPAPATQVIDVVEAADTVQDEAALANTAWQAVSFGSLDDGIPVIPDTYPSLHFLVDRYSGYTGCNWFLGVYETDGNSMSIETPTSTAGGCEGEELVEQDGTYASSLLNVTNYELADDTLLLYTVEDQLFLTMVPLESLPFAETTWELKFFSTEPEYWQAHLPDTLITAQYNGEQITGTAGCNDYSASYTRSDDQLTLGELTVTQKTCDDPEGVMGQESEYLSMLATAGAVIESARTLELLTSDGTPLLLYHGN